MKAVRTGGGEDFTTNIPEIEEGRGGTSEDETSNGGRLKLFLVAL